ncbi:MAG: EamA family transporter [Leptolyngbyaceae cyanobacterium SL_7_1]|nr:EamA family transporter [Leptolyngbyaceae cyanobacterium SL_7_1]
MRSMARISLPPTGLVLLSIASMHCGAAFAKLLFPQVGAAGMVLMRVGFAALILFALRRPQWTPQIQAHLRTLASFGIVLALMNLAFYASLDRIPLGIAATLEFTGPLGLAALRSKRWLEALWVALAAIGVVLLAPIGDFTLDIWGIAFALIAGFFLALYIVLSAQVGQVIPGIDGLFWAMAIAALLLAPIGIASAGNALLQPHLLAVGLGVAVLSSTVPYSLELMALRSIPINTFGVLRSLEPMSAAIAGFLVLGEALTLRTLSAIVLISLAAAGASRFQSRSNQVPATDP